jgi:hypothetical protein
MEYAAEEGLTATSQFIQSLRGTLGGRLEQVQGMEMKGQLPAATSSGTEVDGPGEAGSSSSQGLRKRPAQRLPSASKLGEKSSVQGKSAAASGPDDLDDTAALKAKHKQAMQARQQLTMTQAAHAVVWGFGPDVEQHYRKWVPQHYSAQVRAWCMVTVLMVVVGIIKSTQAGIAVIQAHLPAHLIIVAPYIGSILVVAKAQQR